MSPYEDDEDERKESILKMLSGEVDDYAGSQLKDPNEKESQGVTIEISIKPHGGDSAEHEDAETPEEEKEEHDPIAHILGMCGGGCTK